MTTSIVIHIIANNIVIILLFIEYDRMLVKNIFRMQININIKLMINNIS